MNDETVKRLRAELLRRGYKDIPEHNGLRIGARVRHRGHQWPEAYREGTATIAVLMEKNPSSWSQIYERPDIELLAVHDDASRGIGKWADYHVEVIRHTN